MTGIKPDRRQVVRAGAWTVPAIAVAVAAPAFATSVEADLSETLAPTVVSYTGKVLTFTWVIKNSGGLATTNLRVVVSFAAGQDASATGTVAPTGPPAVNNWTVVSVTGTTVTYSPAGGAQLSGNSSTNTLTFKAARQSASGTTTGTIQAFTDNGPDTLSFPFGPYPGNA